MNSIKWASVMPKKDPFENILCTERTQVSGTELPKKQFLGKFSWRFSMSLIHTMLLVTLNLPN